MAGILSARAYANNEVAYVAWKVDGRIKGCLGFEVTRVYLDAEGNPARRRDGSEDRVKCAAWVPFKGQRNPDWLPQDTGVWPVQKMSWRDLTARKRRNGMRRRPADVRVRYEVRPVGNRRPGLEPVPPNGLEKQEVVRRDAAGRPVVGADGKPVKVRKRAYSGKARPLAYLGPAVVSNDVAITARRAPFVSTFTNGILAAQWLRNVLLEDGVLEKGELLKKIENPADPHRKYLAGDVLGLLRELFAREGRFRLALYELEDAELEALIVDNAARVELILSNTGKGAGGWDVRNAPARARLRQALGKRLQDRMFNNNTHIGHNKFVVHLDAGGTPQAVFTGSTNWTSTGIAAQTNNAILIEDAAVATAFNDFWLRLAADRLKTPKPLSAPMNDNQQGAALRSADATAVQSTQGATSVTVWFSPNRPERRKPAKAPVPPDLEEVYRCMRQARDVILFLAFYPGQRGADSIIGEAVEIGRRDSSLLVTGAVSSAMAMPNYVPGKQDEDAGEEAAGDTPTTFDERNISIIRAARIDDKSLLADFGVEQLTPRGTTGAIIHDKILVVDPLSSDCTVVLGSHNLGFKASYSNDENLLIVKGHRELAQAYAVHVLDVYDHYRFRALQNSKARQGAKAWSGFLDTTDDWQDDYVARRKGAIGHYFAG